MMRITTGMVFDHCVSSMQRQNAELFKVQQQIAYRRRWSRPSTTAVARPPAPWSPQARACRPIHHQTRTTPIGAHGNGRQLPRWDTSSTSLALAGANGAINDSDRLHCHRAARALSTSCWRWANSRDGAGNYMFSGYQTDTKPYDAVVGGAVTYNGDLGIRQIQTAPSRQTTVSAPGPDVFTGLFETLSNLVTALETPSVPGAGNSAAVAAVTTAVEGFDAPGQHPTVRARSAPSVRN